MLKTKDFHYNLPKNLIAQKPLLNRDSSRLMVIDQDLQDDRIHHDYFYNIINYLKAGDVLVLNNTKVIPARLFGHKKTGGKIEIFLLKNLNNNIWNCLIKGKVDINSVIKLKDDYIGKIICKNNDDTWQIKFNKKGVTDIGETPTPPYIKKKAKLDRYQTVFAKHPGSVAAPTAGLHFTPKLLKKLENQGIIILYVTLHVGLGTFAPIRTNNLDEIKLHSEYFSVEKQVISKINQAKQKNNRIVSVGTTSTRVLESLEWENNKLIEKDYNNLSTNIFISPGYEFKVINGLITNFHLPESSLIMLVAAFYNLEGIKKAYQGAVEKKYRFYSFGDAMLLL